MQNLPRVLTATLPNSYPESLCSLDDKDGPAATYMILKKVNVNNHFKNSQSEKKCVTYIINQGFINLIYKEFLKSKKKKINCPIEKWTKEVIPFTET